MIGLKRGTVKLNPYNPKWKELFETEKQLLLKTFGSIIISIEHIGSTAVPGMASKPIIDIDIGIESLEIAQSMEEEFKKLGYERRQTQEENKWEELYVKGPEENRTHYLHMMTYNCVHWKNDILFRNYLRNNPSRAKEYSDLKQKLASTYADNRAKYTQSKKDFIDETLRLANRKLN